METWCPLGRMNVNPERVARIYHRFALFALRRGGWPLPRSTVEPLRDFANRALGVGSAHLGVRESGESDVLRVLASAWAAREVVTVIDVGAYAGDYASAVRSAFGDKAIIHCFEPNPAMFAGLYERLSGDVLVTCHQVALGRESGSALLFLDHPGSPRGSLEEGSFRLTDRPIEARHTVEVQTLDEVAKHLALTRIDLVKLDVEGFEIAVLEGAAELLAKQSIDVVQFEFGEANLASRTYMRDFFHLLGSRYVFYRVSPRGLRRMTYRPKHETFAGETNYLAVSGEMAHSLDPLTRGGS